MKGERNKFVFAKWKVVISIFLLVCMAVALVFSDKLEVLLGYKKVGAAHNTNKATIETGAYSVSYIDVGQGSSTFVELPDGKNMIIDGGDIEYGKTVVDYLTSRNVTKIDYMIATHADSDHIGGLNSVLDNFEVLNIYRPFQISIRARTDEEKAAEPENTENYVVYEFEDLAEVYEDLQESSNGKSKVCKISTTVYRNFIEKIYTETYTGNSGETLSSVSVFYDGLHIAGENYDIEFFGPLKRDENIDISDYSSRTSGFVTKGYGASSSSSNDNSAIFMLECFDDKFLFLGDARFTESKSSSRDFSEYNFIDSLTSSERLSMADVDVLLVGHHGSKYSTSTELLEIVCPRFTVISVGKNDYGHPEDVVLERIANSSGLESDYLLRTDKNGDIVFSNINGELLYYAEKQEVKEQLEISFRLLVVIVTGCVLVFIWSIRVKKSKKRRKQAS